MHQKFLISQHKAPYHAELQHDRGLYAENGKQIFHESEFDPGLTDEEWNIGWGLMAQDKTYEVSYLGDLMFMSLYHDFFKNVPSSLTLKRGAWQLVLNT